MKHSIVTTGALLLAAAAPAVDPLAGLGWLADRWVVDDGKRWVDESWSDARAGVMLGTNRWGAGGDLQGYEFMRLAPGKDGVPTYWASPNGAPAAPFRLTAAGAASATFENPANDYPTRITYHREGDRLHAIITGKNGANPQSWTYVRRKIPLLWWNEFCG